MCSLLGHKYGDETVEEHQEEQNGKTATIEISKKECLRCQKVREDRRNASITNDDSETNSEDSDEDRSRKSQDESSEADDNENNAIFESAGYTSHNKDIIEDEADGGVILETSNDSGSDSTKTIDDLRSESNSERTAEDDEGAFRLGNSDNDENESQTTEYRVICESCTFSSVEKETSRRDGDLCPECGSWLEVKRLNDTDTSES